MQYLLSFRPCGMAILYLAAAAVAGATPSVAQPFEGLGSATLPTVADTPGAWGLRIVVLNVGQADAILVITPNGDVCLIDSGKTSAAGNRIVGYLSTKTLNGVGNLKTIDLLYTSHYDLDHIGGLRRIVERGVRVRKAFDQGLSRKRNGKPRYVEYVTALGDPNNNLVQDDDEPGFVRHKLHYGHLERMGLEDEVEVHCVSARGDTKGQGHDWALDPSVAKINENPGCIALVIRLGEFEFYTAGDQTGNEWRPSPAIEEAVVNSGAIPAGPDIDVLKVNHHGSDTSSSSSFVQALDPEVAIISTRFTRRDRLPKRITLKQFQENRCYVLITGDGIDPEMGGYADSSRTPLDDTGVFTVNESVVFNDQGNVTILVSCDGRRYTVMGDSFAGTFSAVDADNVH